MPVKVKYDDSEAWFDVVESENSVFILEHESGDTISIEIPLKLDSSFNDKDFEVYFFTKKNIKENDIFQVFCRKTNSRIGWIIPTISLSSTLHDFSDNIHFLKYAYIGVREALKKLDSNVYSNCLPRDIEKCLFSEIFHEETVLLILSSETYEPDFKFEIDRAIPSLIKHGYVRLNTRNPNEIKHDVQSEIENKLYLEEISSDINSCSLIRELLCSSFSYEEKAVFKFFFLYQIIELLIDNIYQNEQESLIDELVEAKGDSGRTKETLDKLQQFMSEKKRIALLMDEYTRMNNDLTDLKTACNKLLLKLGRKESDNFEGYFYKIRNCIFHQYRDFPLEADKLLDNVIQEIIYLMPTILSKFKLSNEIQS